jgi:hypothetical protein
VGALTIYDTAANQNKGIVFKSREYQPFTGEQFDLNVIYYENKNGEYLKTIDTSPVASKIYYILGEKESFNIGAEGLKSGE